MAFSKTDFDSINIGSVWKSDRISEERETQTNDISSVETGVQHNSQLNIETQTSDPNDTHIARPLKTFNSSELIKFLRKSSEVTIEEMKKIRSNDIFERIDKYHNQNKPKVSILQKFNANKLNLNVNKSEVEYIPSSVCWNCNGSGLSVAFKVKSHSDWCTHESYALFWNLFKVTSNEEPNSTLEIDGCVSTFISHPKHPSIYCSGALNGRISLWNTRNNENEIIFGSVSAHRSAVTALHWIPSNGRTDFDKIISCGLDGKILIWKVNDKSIQLFEAFVILAQDMPRTIHIKGDKSEAEVGIECLSLNCEDPNIFIIGCIGGAIFQCSLVNKKPVLYKSQSSISTKDKNIEFKSPIVMSYASHRSHVNVVQFSPISRNVFFSCSSDSELRIYNILQSVPLIVIHTDVPLVSSQWSPSQPIIAGVGTDGRVYIYSINDTRVSNSLLNFSIGENIFAKSLIYNNIEGKEQIAIIASNNEIQIWDLSHISGNSDGKYLNDVLNRMSDED